MATFKDIAKLSGVSYGTVSNVINGNGNVSSEKMHRVLQAADQLGYTRHQGAQILRKGKSNQLSVILPNVIEKPYTDFFIGFNKYAKKCGYSVSLNLHENNLVTEQKLATEIHSTLAEGVAIYNTSTDDIEPYSRAGFNSSQLLFVEQKPAFACNYIGLDYMQIGVKLGARAREFQHVALLTEQNSRHVSSQIKEGFMSELEKSPECKVQLFVKKPQTHSTALAIEILSSTLQIQAVFTTKINFAQSIFDVQQAFFPMRSIKIFTVSPLHIMPKSDYLRYEANYCLLGEKAAQQLITSITMSTSSPKSVTLQTVGFRNWLPSIPPSQSAINMLTLDSPTADIVKNFSRLYTLHTGVPVNITTTSYDKLRDLTASNAQLAPYDIIRVDAIWMHRLNTKVFMPLNQIGKGIENYDKVFFPGILKRYSGSTKAIYALPETPSTQIMLYRRDLFEDVILQRLYKEQNGELLRPPNTFKEYNRIARFFTKSITGFSPVLYGSTLTLGNGSVAATEFLTRYFALTNNLFDGNDRLQLTSPAGIQALEELVELQAYAHPSKDNWWRETARIFSEGEVAMTILYSNYASEILGKGSRIHNQIGYAMVPGGNPIWGGGSIGINRYSNNKELALHFLQWLLSEEISTAMTYLGSVSPWRSIRDNYQIIDAYPWLDMAQESFEKSRINRVPHNHSNTFDEQRFLDILGTRILNVMNGNESISNAMSDIEKQYRR